MSVTDPITPVRPALWAILEAEPAFSTTLVPIGNRLKDATSRGNPRKPSVQPADFPSMVIEPVDGIFTNDFSSTCGDVTKKYLIKLATGKWNPDKITEIEWVIFAAMSGWKAILGELSWRGKIGYVTHCAVYDFSETTKEKEQTRLESGWAAVLGIEVRMHFDRVDIVAGPG